MICRTECERLAAEARGHCGGRERVAAIEVLDEARAVDHAARGCATVDLCVARVERVATGNSGKADRLEVGKISEVTRVDAVRTDCLTAKAHRCYAAGSALALDRAGKNVEAHLRATLGDAIGEWEGVGRLVRRDPLDLVQSCNSRVEAAAEAIRRVETRAERVHEVVGALARCARTAGRVFGIEDLKVLRNRRRR